MWFVETLLYFTIFYIGYRLIFRPVYKAPDQLRKLPGDLAIFIFAAGIGLGSFLIRIWLPVGWNLEPLGLQLPHFLQYISLLIFGVIAYRNDWLKSITYQRGMKWFILAQVCIFVFFPIIFLGGGAASGNLDAFMGGWHWQSFAYAIYEQVLGFSLIIGLLGIFKEKWNGQGNWAKTLSASTYTVYIIHPPIIIFLALGFRQVELYPPFKFLLLAPIALVLCFGLANIIRKLPLARKIL